MNEKGFATIILLGVLVLLTTVSFGVGALLRCSGALVRGRENEFEERMKLHEEANRVIQFLVSDETPASDSCTDRVWEYIHNTKHDGLTVSLEDVSSRYGLNWIRKDVLDYSGLLRPGRSAGELQQYRWEMGPVLQLAPHYRDFFSETSIHSYFTPYSYYNINISDEFIIEKLVVIRTGDRERGRVLRMKLLSLWEASQKGRPAMIEASRLSEFLGNDYEALYPVINAEPAINVHFAPEDILYHLFLFHHHDISEGTVDHIIRCRKEFEWDLDDLENLLGPEYGRGFLHHYIGVTTWFWELKLRPQPGACGNGSHSLRMVLARVPPHEPYSTDRRYRVIEEEYM